MPEHWEKKESKMHCQTKTIINGTEKKIIYRQLGQVILVRG